MTTATTAIDALMLDILAHPEDDAPRLVYADALEERGAPGDDARSEFVRVQVELATFPAEYEIAEGVVKVLYAGGENRATYAKGYVPKSVQRYCDRFLTMRRRERELLCSAWGGSAALISTNMVFRRGFVASVTCTAADCLANLDAIRAVQPVTEVTLTTWPEIEHDHRSTPEPDDIAATQIVVRLNGRGRWMPIPNERIMANTWEQMRPDFVRRLLRAEWPRIAFTLPSDDGGFTIPPHTPGSVALFASP